MVENCAGDHQEQLARFSNVSRMVYFVDHYYSMFPLFGHLFHKCRSNFGHFDPAPKILFSNIFFLIYNGFQHHSAKPADWYEYDLYILFLYEPKLSFDQIIDQMANTQVIGHTQ